LAADLAGPGYHINRSNLALTFAQRVAPAEVEEEDEEEEFGRYSGSSSSSGWMR